MRRFRWQRLFAVVAVMALVAGACDGDDDEEAEEDETTEETEAEEELPVEGVLVTASEYEFGGDVEELHASTATVTFRNEGNVAHEMTMFRLPEDTAPDEFLEDFDKVVEGEGAGPYPGYWFDPGAFGGMGVVAPGEQAISEFSLTEGNWLMFCSLSDEDTDDEGGGGGDEESPAGRAQDEEEEAQLPPHYQLGMQKVIEVSGSADPTPPERGTAVTAQEDGDTYSFEGTDALKAGEQDIAIVNPSTNEEAHHGLLFEFGEGVEAEDVPGIFQEVFSEEEGGGGGEEEPAGRAQEDEGPPPFEEAGGSAVFTPGFGGTIHASLESGRTYAFVCFISDKEGGPPHAIGHNMITPFTIA